MRASEIYLIIEKFKVFQITDIVKELEKEWGFLGKSFIKSRTESVVYSWLKWGRLVKVNENPPIFALKEAAGEWKKHYRQKRCPVCGKKFYKRRGEQDRYCSAKCRERAKAERRKEETRKRVKKYLHSADKTAVNRGKPWSRKEISLMLKLKNEGKTCREIAEKLGRTVYSVRWKLQTVEVKNA